MDLQYFFDLIGVYRDGGTILLRIPIFQGDSYRPGGREVVNLFQSVMYVSYLFKSNKGRSTVGFGGARSMYSCCCFFISVCLLVALS